MIEIDWVREILDTIVCLAGKYAKWLNINKNKYCFVIGIVVLTYWMIRDFYLGLYSQGLFCIVSLGFDIFGLIKWGKDDEQT